MDTSISNSSVYEVDPDSYSVGIGHEFGLVCNTSGFYEVSWYWEDMGENSSCNTEHIMFTFAIECVHKLPHSDPR